MVIPCPGAFRGSNRSEPDFQSGILHNSGQLLGRLQFTFDEGAINDQLRYFIRKLSRAPDLDLSPHRFEITLHAVNAYRKAVLEPEILCVFC